MDTELAPGRPPAFSAHCRVLRAGSWLGQQRGGDVAEMGSRGAEASFFPDAEGGSGAPQPHVQLHRHCSRTARPTAVATSLFVSLGSCVQLWV